MYISYFNKTHYFLLWKHSNKIFICTLYFTEEWLFLKQIINDVNYWKSENFWDLTLRLDNSSNKIHVSLSSWKKFIYPHILQNNIYLKADC